MDLGSVGGALDYGIEPLLTGVSNHSARRQAIDLATHSVLQQRLMWQSEPLLHALPPRALARRRACHDDGLVLSVCLSVGGSVVVPLHGCGGREGRVHVTAARNCAVGTDGRRGFCAHFLPGGPSTSDCSGPQPKTPSPNPIYLLALQNSLCLARGSPLRPSSLFKVSPSSRQISRQHPSWGSCRLSCRCTRPCTSTSRPRT